MINIYLFLIATLFVPFLCRYAKSVFAVLPFTIKGDSESRHYLLKAAQSPPPILMKNHLNKYLTFSKATVTLILVLFSISWANAQSIFLTGTDICTDGTQSTEIGITDSDPTKHYALFRDGLQLMMFQQHSDQETNPITFGTFSEPGIYRVFQFDRHGSNMNPNNGIAIGEKIHIKPMPVLLVSDEPITTQSGMFFTYEPKSDIRDASYSWTATVTRGKMKKFTDRGRGDINQKLELEGEKPAQIVFSITPVAPDHLGGCMGDTSDIIVNIEP
jgi:hypothetical protein